MLIEYFENGCQRIGEHLPGTALIRSLNSSAYI